jgi:hypothetical protein
MLEVPPYPSDTPWKEITDKKNERMEMVEWIPADQSEDTIRVILTKQVSTLPRIKILGHL